MRLSPQSSHRLLNLREDEEFNLALPVERREVSVVVAAGVIPIQAEDVQVTVCRFRQREAGIGGMESVVNVQRLTRFGSAGDAFNGLVEHARDGDRAFHAVLLKANRFELDPEHLGHKRTEPRHRTACLTAANPG